MDIPERIKYIKQTFGIDTSYQITIVIKKYFKWKRHLNKLASLRVSKYTDLKSLKTFQYFLASRALSLLIQT